VVFLSFSAAKTDFPPSVSGFGSVMGLNSWLGQDESRAEVAELLTNTVKAGRVFTKVLRFI
jgi:hypothetical protein